MDVARLKDWSLRIWGSRGSVPVSGPQTQRHGGATTCIELDLGDARIIIDAGSGLADLGRTAVRSTKPTLLLMTHLHWDHVLGFPHFAPLYMPGWTLDIRGVQRDGVGVLEALHSISQPPLFPVDLRVAAAAQVSTENLPSTGASAFHGAEIAWMPVAHPGGCTAFWFQLGGYKIIFTGDLELRQTDLEALHRFAHGADLLICDAQYTEEEYVRYTGWGHSTNMDAATLAQACGAKQLLLTHHDPRRTDDEIDAMVAAARTLFPNTQAARDGLTFSGSF